MSWKYWEKDPIYDIDSSLLMQGQGLTQKASRRRGEYTMAIKKQTKQISIGETLWDSANKLRGSVEPRISINSLIHKAFRSSYKANNTKLKRPPNILKYFFLALK